ncbi:MAG: S46 family peptidase [Bacteroidales bacterium]|nr:S46 family peptidase [Bacteroidales bacterium]MDD4216815.1 S46 family peptidase [Bacteroidales bacterium]MDY0142705.1 S46 family peptidase [Bacteroidales bacterium]
MKRFLTILLGLSLLFNFNLRADEGMWLLSMMGKNYEEMKKMGFKLTPEDIYSVNNGSIKDAIVGLGNEGSPFRHFCTGEIVSDQGLFFTNHHCGFGMIQSHSTVEHDYLADGFWAMSKDQELSNPGITASVLVKMEDVTDKVLAEITADMSEDDRAAKIKEISKGIVAEATKENLYDAYVTDMFDNNQFFLFVYVIYKDVRLVGAPPSSMGKFGGDTDNWEWPRHTADFSMFRIYTAPDGKPAAFSEDNIPLKPKHFLPVSNKGVKNDDFAMILGFPGTTNRYLTSYGLEETMNITNKLRFEIRDVKIKILREEMKSSQKVRIQYATKYARCSNYWKYSEQQNKALKQLNTIAVKKDIEKQYEKWANNNKTEIYKETLGLIETAYKTRQPYAVARMYLIEGLISGTELPYFAYQCSGLISALDSKDEDKIQKNIQIIKVAGDEFYKDYNPDTEKKVIAALFEYTYNNLDKQYHPDVFQLIEKKYKGDFGKFVDKAFDKSIFATKESFNEFMNNPKSKTLQNDMMMNAGTSILKKYREVNALFWSSSDGLDKGRRLFTRGLMYMNDGKLMYPDANSTIRLTYGKVGKYDPRDAVAYDYYTTLKGVIEKEDPNSTEFAVPKKLKDLYYAKDFGPYANEKGELSVCFITDNDITGGNSGSPVINAEGHLIGLAFDGNSEAMSGDIDFEENLQRCINLDVRYALFIIDKYAGAKNLIEEMDIRN